MQFEYKLKATDYFCFSAWHNFYNPINQLLFGAIALWIGATSATELPVQIACALITYLLMWAAQWALVSLYVLFAKKKTLLAHTSLSLSPAGVHEKTVYGTTQFAWPGVLKVAKRGKLICLYTQSHAAMTIPFRALPPGSHYKQVMSEIEQLRRAHSQP